MSARIHILSALIAASALSPTWAQEQDSACFVDNLPAPNATQAYEAQMRALMMAHTPIEYRNSCGLLDDSDKRFFDAIRAQTNCQASDGYMKFFGQYLSDAESYLFAVKRTDLRSDEDFETYCTIVAEIDLAAAVNEDGSVNVEMLQAQAPLFQALQAFTAEKRWDQ